VNGLSRPTLRHASRLEILLPLPRIALLAAIVPLCAACNWIALASNALTYHTMRPGETGNLVALDSMVYATRGATGLSIVDGRTGAELGSLEPPSGSGSIDDITIDGSLLFVLDAVQPGAVSVFSLADPLHPALISASQFAPVGPFSGISATHGVAMVSGGTSQLTVWSYEPDGQLHGPVATSDLGRGQPDILLTPEGVAFVSTHYRGPYFGLEVIRFDSTSRSVVKLGSLKLDGAGFTAGGAKPASFPIDVALLTPDTLLIAFARGVAVVNVANPSSPQLLRIIDAGGKAVNIDVQGQLAAVTVTGANPAVVLLDFSLAEPLIRRIPLPQGTKPVGVVFTGSRVGVAARERGVLLLDRSTNESKPRT
jgi:hypothetical protein